MDQRKVKRTGRARWLLALPADRKSFNFNDVLALAVRRGERWRVDLPAPRPDGVTAAECVTVDNEAKARRRLKARFPGAAIWMVPAGCSIQAMRRNHVEAMARVARSAVRL